MKNNLTESAATDINLGNSITRAAKALCEKQQSEGFWCFELEADCTIPSEYILMMHFMDEIDEQLQDKLAVYIRRKQNEEGGWPLYYGGEVNLSCTVKAYYALKLAGDDIDADHMTAARDIILQMGGAAKSNVFTRIELAKFEQMPWRGVPFLPVEMVLFPSWFPISMQKVSYWSRTVMVPLFILYTLRASAKNPQNIGVQELFVIPPEEETDYFEVRSKLNKVILKTERMAFRLKHLIPDSVRRRALKKATSWFMERLNGTSGLGAIFPAMVNAYEAMDLMGIPENDPKRTTAKKALEKLLVIREDEAYCQPCVSPVWDTLLSIGALDETGLDLYENKINEAVDWLVDQQLTDEPGDWQERRPKLKNGSWPFQFRNDYYPDLDDTAFASYVLYQHDYEQYQAVILRAARWLKGMQSSNGGFAAFEIDNTHYYLNEIPFADHGALLDPPTSDVTARCLMLFGLLRDDYPEFEQPIKTGLQFLTDKQEADGSWFGRWGTNYIYGTWSVLMGLESIGLPESDPRIRKAVTWLRCIQRNDGGWGESNGSYHDPIKRGQAARSTSSQTAWALLGLLAAGEAHSAAVQRGIKYLTENQQESGLWSDPEFTAPGFPRVFYLKYHGYTQFFPLWALSRYKKEMNT